MPLALAKMKRFLGVVPNLVRGRAFEVKRPFYRYRDDGLRGGLYYNKYYNNE
jgi:hypothetical protein